ncbi:sec-independent translocase [Streptomyces sp. CB01881]|uniref:sec-independent translocase n=1 Tax=Streptomyces sp. CB01881 TaxID=2078691 RepID=UPI000CDBE43E|nr:sec-independent translocase [Streptomyces sp. CB01881]AUY49951.1 Sec-independent protein translocase TatB [Streptomyces sp. CB01881]TYC73349.1 Sec-independent protein translocase subunit TatB [Streptomyces sp. CB01881]
MFSDVGGMEVLTLVIMAIVIFGPDKLPKLIQDTMGFIRKIRSFADNAKEDIRSELGPEFKDFEFEDLHPKTFVRKQLMGGNEDPLGLKEMRDGLDIRSVLDDKPAATVNGHGRTGTVSMDKSSAAAPAAASAGAPLQPGERPPFDPDAT